RVGSSEEHGVAGHFRENGFAVRAREGWLEHVVSEPIPEHMTALIAFEPVSQAGVKRHRSEEAKGQRQRSPGSVTNQRKYESQRESHQQQIRKYRQAVLI